MDVKSRKVPAFQHIGNPFLNPVAVDHLLHQLVLRFVGDAQDLLGNVVVAQNVALLVQQDKALV